MGARVDDEVIDVDNDVIDAVDDGLHQALKACWTSEETHGGGDPFELSHARQGEGGVLSGFGVQQHLPES